MKNKFAAGLLVLSFSVMAQAACPKNWPVTIIEKNDEIYIKVENNLIKNGQQTGDTELEISSQFGKYVEIKGNNVEVSLVNKSLSGKIIDEKWTTLGTITQTEIDGKRTCHKLQVETAIKFSEISEYHRPDCGFLPKIMCGKQKHNYLKISKEINNKAYYTKSSTSISAN